MLFKDVKIGDFIKTEQGLGDWVKVLHVNRVCNKTVLLLDSDITPLIRSCSNNKVDIQRRNE